MTDCSQKRLRLSAAKSPGVRHVFAGGDVTSNGGAALLRQADHDLALTGTIFDNSSLGKNSMNRVIKELVTALLEADIDTARQKAQIFPDHYGTRLLTKKGILTEMGLWDAVDFPFSKALGNRLIGSFNKEEAAAARLISEHRTFCQVFRLINEKTGGLSDFATVKAIQAMKLEQQCLALGVGFDTINVRGRKAKVEPLVAKHYSKQGFTTSCLEGGDFLLLMRCASWQLLSYTCEHNHTPYLEAMLVDQENPAKVNKSAASALLKGIQKSNAEIVKRNFDRIYPKSSAEKQFPGLTSRYIAGLYEVVGTELLYAIAKFFVTNPYKFRRGWPDITAYKLKRLGQNEARLALREVKVRDKLLPSQIITFVKLRPLISDLKVVRVNFITSK